jgi:glycosyltransferase involved in cell wall biosynthesis
LKILFINTFNPYEERFGGSVAASAELDLLKENFEVETLFSQTLPNRFYNLNYIRLLKDVMTFKSIKLSSYGNLHKDIDFYKQYDLLWCNTDLTAYDYKIFVENKIPFLVRKYNIEYKLVNAKTLFGKYERMRLESFELDLQKKAQAIIHISFDEYNEDVISTNKYLLYPPLFKTKNKKNDSLLVSESKFDLLNVSSFDWPPNKAGMQWFVDKVVPLLDTKITIELIGNQSEMFSSIAQINVNGYVDDIDLFYRKGKIFIAPIVYGAGIKIKIIEAMMNKIPVITTSIGVEGLEGIVNGKHIIIKDTPYEMAKAIKDLLNNDSLRQSLAQDALIWVEENLSSEKWLEQTNDIIKEAIGK